MVKILIQPYARVLIGLLLFVSALANAASSEAGERVEITNPTIEDFIPIIIGDIRFSAELSERLQYSQGNTLYETDQRAFENRKIHSLGFNPKGEPLTPEAGLGRSTPWLKQESGERAASFRFGDVLKLSYVRPREISTPFRFTDPILNPTVKDIYQILFNAKGTEGLAVRLRSEYYHTDWGHDVQKNHIGILTGVTCDQQDFKRERCSIYINYSHVNSEPYRTDIAQVGLETVKYIEPYNY